MGCWGDTAVWSRRPSGGRPLRGRGRVAERGSMCGYAMRKHPSLISHGQVPRRPLSPFRTLVCEGRSLPEACATGHRAGACESLLFSSCDLYMGPDRSVRFPGRFFHTFLTKGPRGKPGRAVRVAISVALWPSRLGRIVRKLLLVLLQPLRNTSRPGRVARGRAGAFHGAPVCPPGLFNRGQLPG